MTKEEEEWNGWNKLQNGTNFRMEHDWNKNVLDVMWSQEQ